MPDQKLIRIYYEGDDDRVALEGLKVAGLLDESWEIAVRSKKLGGRDGVVQDLLPFVCPVGGVGGRAMVLLDLDDLDAAGLHAWFERKIENELRDIGVSVTPTPSVSPSRTMLAKIEGGGFTGRLALVPVGLPDDPDLTAAGYHVERFALDDHMMRFIRDSRVYAGVSEFRAVEHSVALRVLNDVANLLRSNGIEIRSSKRYLHLMRAITDFRPSGATLIQRLIESARDTIGVETVRQYFEPLVEDLHTAARALAS